MAVVPLAIWPRLVDDVLFKDVVFFLGIGLLLIGSSVFGQKKGLILDKQIYLIFGFLGLVALSTWFSIHREISIFGAQNNWQAALTFVVLAATYFVALQIKWDPSRIRTLIIVLVCVAVGLSLFALIKFGYEFAESGPVNRIGKARALFPNPNMFAFFLMAVYPLALRLFLEAGIKKAGRALLGVGCILIFAANIIIFSRTGWVVSIVVLLAVLLVSGKKKAALAMVVTLGVIVLLARGEAGQGADLKSYTSTRLMSVFQSSSLAPRLNMWRVAKDLTLDRPLTGYGPDTFSLALVRHEPIGLAAFKNKPRTPHNFVLFISSTLGVPALILIFLIFFRSIRTAWASGDYLKQTLGLSMIAMIILSQGIIWHPYMALPFWVFMAVVSPDKFSVRASKVPALRLGAAMIAISVVGWSGALAVADHYYFLGASSKDNGQARLYLNRAVAINPYAYSYWSALFKNSRAEIYQDRLSIVARAKKHHPLSERTLVMEATLRYQHGKGARRTLDLLDEAIKIRPYYVDAHLLKGNILLERGRYEEAVREFETILEIRPVKNKYVRQALAGIKQISVRRSGQR